MFLVVFVACGLESLGGSSEFCDGTLAGISDVLGYELLEARETEPYPEFEKVDGLRN